MLINVCCAVLHFASRCHCFCACYKAEKWAELAVLLSCTLASVAAISLSSLSIFITASTSFSSLPIRSLNLRMTSGGNTNPVSNFGSDPAQLGNQNIWCAYLLAGPEPSRCSWPTSQPPSASSSQILQPETRTAQNVQPGLSGRPGGRSVWRWMAW